jgi:N-acetylneuraminic acid mutarotase
MLEPRCYAAMAVMDGKLYVAGGYYGQVNLDSVEVFDTASGDWQALPRMATPRRFKSASLLRHRHSSSSKPHTLVA